MATICAHSQPDAEATVEALSMRLLSIAEATVRAEKGVAVPGLVGVVRQP